MIYHLALSDPTQRSIIVDPHRPPQEPNILRICQQIRNEALPIYYGTNAFQFATTSDAVAWLKHIGSEKRAMLKQLRGFSPVDVQELELPALGYREDWAQCLSTIYNVEAAFAEARVKISKGVFHYMVIAHDAIDFWNEGKLSTTLSEDEFATFWARSEWIRLLKEEEGWDLSDALELRLGCNPGV